MKVYRLVQRYFVLSVLEEVSISIELPLPLNKPVLVVVANREAVGGLIMKQGLRHGESGAGGHQLVEIVLGQGV